MLFVRRRLNTAHLRHRKPNSNRSIHPGDSVWSYNQSSQEWQLATVENTQVRDYFGEMVRLEISISDGSSDRTESIDCTGGHPFWVVSGVQLDERPACTELPIHDSQMTPSGRWTEARWLRLGDRFLTRTGASATVSGLTIRTERVQTVFAPDRLRASHARSRLMLPQSIELELSASNRCLRPV